MKCRLYNTDAGLSGLRPDEWILDAITHHPAAPDHQDVDDMSSTSTPRTATLRTGGPAAWRRL
jgi:hypothetical protein